MKWINDEWKTFSGIEFNKDGKKYIWPEDTRQAIKQKTECFANQYEKFKNNSENKIIKEVRIFISFTPSERKFEFPTYLPYFLQ